MNTLEGAIVVVIYYAVEVCYSHEYIRGGRRGRHLLCCRGLL